MSAKSHHWTYPNRVTRPLEEAVMEPSSSMVYSAEMLSCRNRPSGSFFCSAYHFPAYCHDKEESQKLLLLLYFFYLLFLTCMHVCVFQFTHPLWVKVLFDIEAVNDTWGRQTALDAGEQNQQQGQLRGCHSGINISVYIHHYLTQNCACLGLRIPEYHKCTNIILNHKNQKVVVQYVSGVRNTTQFKNIKMSMKTCIFKLQHHISQSSNY